MNLYSPTVIKSIFKKYGIKPKKYLGQNFVVNKSVINNIVKAAELNAADTIIEIGPGLGALTMELAKKAKQVIAVEKDKIMCEILQKMLQEENIKNVAVINADILIQKIGNCPVIGRNPPACPVGRSRAKKLEIGNWSPIFLITSPSR